MNTEDIPEGESKLAEKEGVPDPKREPGLTRRQLLRTGAAALTTVAASAILLNRKTSGPSEGIAASLEKVPDHRITGQNEGAPMAIVRGPNPSENARRAIEAIGGMQTFVQKGETVVIKPNVGWNRVPEQAANTQPQVVAAVVKAVKAAGASKIWVVDVPINNAERCFTRSGIRQAAGAAGAEVILPKTNDFRWVYVGGMTLNTAKVFYPFLEVNRVINVPVVKHHGLTGASLAMKNWYGVLGGHRALLHQDIHRSIVDLATMIKPTLTVLDGTLVLMANGPSGGNLNDVKPMNVVAASTDEVAIDALGATLLGRAPADIEFIGLAEQKGLGTSDYRSLDPVEIGG